MDYPSYPRNKSRMECVCACVYARVRCLFIIPFMWSTWTMTSPSQHIKTHMSASVLWFIASVTTSNLLQSSLFSVFFFNYLLEAGSSGENDENYPSSPPVSKIIWLGLRWKSCWGSSSFSERSVPPLAAILAGIRGIHHILVAFNAQIEWIKVELKTIFKKL